jgi:hypothetical protein
VGDRKTIGLLQPGHELVVPDGSDFHRPSIGVKKQSTLPETVWRVIGPHKAREVDDSELNLFERSLADRKRLDVCRDRLGVRVFRPQHGSNANETQRQGGLPFWKGHNGFIRIVLTEMCCFVFHPEAKLWMRKPFKPYGTISPVFVVTSPNRERTLSKYYRFIRCLHD